MNNSFGKEFRLLVASDFKSLKEGSRVYTDRFMRVYYKRNVDKSTKTRIGISVSKKVGNSVVRNRLKRTVREHFRTSLFKHLSYDVLFVVSQKLLNDCDLDSAAKKLHSSLDSFWKKLK